MNIPQTQQDVLCKIIICSCFIRNVENRRFKTLRILHCVDTVQFSQKACIFNTTAARTSNGTCLKLLYHLQSPCIYATCLFQVTDYMQDAEPSPLAAYGSDISLVAVSTKTPSQEISGLPNLSLHPQITTVATQTLDGSARLSNYASIPATDTPGASGIIALPQHASYVPLSPRERKMVEFRESYSPSFLQGNPFRRGGFDMVSVPLTML